MARITNEQFMQLFPSFRKTEGRLAEEILLGSVYKELPARASLYTEGDSCQGIGFVLAGEIRVFKVGQETKEVTLYEIFPGETCILNASCILSNTRYPADAMTLTDVKMLFMPAGGFLHLMARHAELRAYIFQFLSQRLAEIIELLEEVTFGRLDLRLTDYLIQKAENGLLVTTHQNIANDLGSSREVISRLLKDFERKGKLTVSRNRIQLLDL
ncbi:MAG: Crp/Fnr family transcriptional regulator [Syntrophobacteraceae bacterium]